MIFTAFDMLIYSFCASVGWLSGIAFYRVVSVKLLIYVQSKINKLPFGVNPEYVAVTEKEV
jgi:hypothetical protein